MKRSLFIAISAIGSACANGEEMKLVNTDTGFVVVEFKEGKTNFYDRILEAEMKESGIFIPPLKVKDFDGKKVVLLGDPLFEKAFVEIYYPLCIANRLYQWQ